ncbi:hypothetical protein C1X21_12335 [Pseudomonas sp. FW305-3-2-15-A-LB2]|nr:hypothetical protein C1X17_05720 [Pseudomonas sp. FW305-3-2-15-C-TSA2]PMV28940.1 hypothetical protein C1X22_12220 [Pseudomonas sp. DP16D-L5]PMV38935.1 hypothetical protein C1X21_12335 [Pseudomonas sp. FW305-3-2-15-A-LB2]PMV40970.1 hypothetical protein C1X16_24990 [Pseudomonas sp. FW305-3-2-15-C-R2A1]PMV50114.1 hypothetical protein C1X19_26875 [Pseudomonas sp. GW460-4]PMV51247.1 hypothetical protein C1X18_13185 [Pseudomonas sp. FW305-3-2-15-C-LB1]PMV63631.1 hypothetical protein C1X20_09875 
MRKKLFTPEDVIPQVSVTYIKNQLYVSGDGHNTFVAAMEEGFHMKLLLKDFSLRYSGCRHSGCKNWQSIKWADFIGGASAITAPLLPFNSSYITQ